MDEQQRFRATAAGGLAIACLVLAVPFALVRIWNGDLLVGIVGLVATAMLCMHAVLLRNSHRAAKLTLVLLTPLSISYLVYLVHAHAVVGLLWCFPGILVLYCLLPERMAWHSNLVLYGLVLFFGNQVLPADILPRAAVSLLAVNLFAALLLRAVTDQFRSLQRQIVTDPLTGLLNRYDLEQALEARLNSRRRADARSALLALDLDHFKRINDEFGHAVGDDLLREVGGCLNKSIRAGDEAFRIGGEEFLVVLGNLDERDAVQRAEAIRKAVSATHASTGRPVTVSIGVAAALPDDTWSQWMSRADAALYRAKAEGRDRVCVASVAEPERSANEKTLSLTSSSPNRMKKVSASVVA